MKVATWLGPSAIQGIGLFAAEDIAADRVIWVYDNRVDFELKRSEVATLKAPLRELVQKYGYIDYRNRIVLCGDNARFFNQCERACQKFCV